MSHLHLASDNPAVPHPFRTRRERVARCSELGIFGISGGRMLPVVYTGPLPGSLDFARRAAEQRSLPDCVQAPHDII